MFSHGTAELDRYTLKKKAETRCQVSGHRSQENLTVLTRRGSGTPRGSLT